MARKSKLSMMSVESLLKMRDDVTKALAQKASELKQQLSILGGGAPSAAAKTKGRKVAPKYKGPKGELWSGRGNKPRWLVAEMKKGKKLESFAIK
jgi:DNA-binding protein H-NS